MELNFDEPESDISLTDLERWHFRSIDDVVRSLAESDDALGLFDGDPDPVITTERQHLRGQW